MLTLLCCPWDHPLSSKAWGLSRIAPLTPDGPPTLFSPDSPTSYFTENSSDQRDPRASASLLACTHLPHLWGHTGWLLLEAIAYSRHTSASLPCPFSLPPPLHYPPTHLLPNPQLFTASPNPPPGPRHAGLLAGALPQDIDSAVLSARYSLVQEILMAPSLREPVWICPTATLSERHYWTKQHSLLSLFPSCLIFLHTIYRL